MKNLGGFITLEGEEPDCPYKDHDRFHLVWLPDGEYKNGTLVPKDKPLEKSEATHRHYKGGLYKLLFEGTHTETMESMVVYQHVYPHEQKIWIRPASMFYGNIATGERRFSPLKKD